MQFSFPFTKSIDLVDNYHGVEVADPFRWLEDVNDREVLDWTKAQNRYTRNYIDQVDEYQKIKTRLTELWQYPHYTGAIEKKGNVFFRKNNGFENQPSLYQLNPGEEVKKLIDPNTFSEDGTVALMSEFYTKDGSILAYTVSESGSDWQKIQIMDTALGDLFPESLHFTKFPVVAWAPEGSGFFYNRLPDPDSVSPEDVNNYRHVCWHTLGTQQSDDALIFQHHNKRIGVAPSITDDGEYLWLWVYHGTDERNGVYYRRLEDDGEFKVLFEIEQAEFIPLGNDGKNFYIKTTLDAPNGRIVVVNLDKPEPANWVTIVPEQGEAIAISSIVSDTLVLVYFHHASHQIKLFNLDGTRIGEIALPTLGTVTALTGNRRDPRMYFLFSSFLYPDTLFLYDFEEKILKPFSDDQGIEFPVEEYTTQQFFYPSKDGTMVPIFLTYKKGIKLDGNNPTILYGYGGFNLAQTPFFKVWNLTWFEMGGIFALANLRGGSEYGDDWHTAGMLEMKQTVFDDMHAAAEWLIEERYTSSEKLAIEGRSNGGLLTAACMLQRPDLYGAVLCHVPVIDMLRYHKFTLGRYWVPEYGNAEEKKQHFEFLYKYSPLHNVEQGTVYPPVIVTTADTDDRVVPAHSKKFVATLQSKADPSSPYLLRVEERAGHGLGKPISKLVEERADCWAFLVKNLNMDV